MNDRQIQQLIHDLQNGNAQKRRAASYKLGRSGIPSVVPFLIKAYDDEDTSVRQNVLTGLMNLGTDDALEFVRSVKTNITESVRKNITESDLDVAKRELASGTNRNNIIKGLINRGLTQTEADMAFEMAQSEMLGSSEGQHQLADMYRRRMMRGLVITIAGIVITTVSYNSAASSPGGGTYLICWGAILFGVK